MSEPVETTAEEQPPFEIKIRVSPDGKVAISHPENIPYCIYYLELARGMLVQKSLLPKEKSPIITPARIMPKLH
jgi:hypothetical protein